jgi:hypothetical protein
MLSLEFTMFPNNPSPASLCCRPVAAGAPGLAPWHRRPPLQQPCFCRISAAAVSGVQPRVLIEPLGTGTRRFCSGRGSTTAEKVPEIPRTPQNCCYVNLTRASEVVMAEQSGSVPVVVPELVRAKNSSVGTRIQTASVYHRRSVNQKSTNCWCAPDCDNFRVRGNSFFFAEYTILELLGSSLMEIWVFPRVFSVELRKSNLPVAHQQNVLIPIRYTPIGLF